MDIKRISIAAKFFRRFVNLLGKIHHYMKWYLKFYKVLGFFAPKKTYPETENKHKYAIIICARNESTVIGNLIDSIKSQDYPAEKLTVFVVADNCTDTTAEICRRKSCKVYERNDPEKARKGYAMQFVFERIKEDYGIGSFDGYVVFDADNLLQPNFMTELNKAFDTGAGVVVGYRNTKNFDRNFISAGYGIHFYKSMMMYHRPRAVLGTSTHIAGTGFVIASRLVKDGWKYTCLTEDTQFTLNAVAQGEHIAFCEDAEFFDEQPYRVRIMLRQRMRWIKGRLYSFLTTFPALFRGIFTNGVRGYACYDMIAYSFPTSTFFAFKQIVFPAAGRVISHIYSLFVGSAVVSQVGIGDEKRAWYIFVFAVSESLFRRYLRRLLTETAVVIREHRHIRCGLPKLIFYTMLSPWFDAIGVPLALLSLFSTSEWRPIKHDADITIDELNTHDTNAKQ